MFHTHCVWRTRIGCINTTHLCVYHLSPGVRVGPDRDVRAQRILKRQWWARSEVGFGLAPGGGWRHPTFKGSNVKFKPFCINCTVLEVSVTHCTYVYLNLISLLSFIILFFILRPEMYFIYSTCPFGVMLCTSTENWQPILFTEIRKVLYEPPWCALQWNPPCYTRSTKQSTRKIFPWGRVTWSYTLSTWLWNERKRNPH